MSALFNEAVMTALFAVGGGLFFVGLPFLAIGLRLSKDDGAADLPRRDL